nr:MAG TPA: hypothetical protein [Caudoviricetes sp.]
MKTCPYMLSFFSYFFTMIQIVFFLINGGILLS